MTHRCNNKPINLDGIHVPIFKVTKRQLDKSFEDGCIAAENHFRNEDTQDLPYGVKTWSTYPYQVVRLEAYHSWMAGFYHKWFMLVRGEHE